MAPVEFLVDLPQRVRQISHHIHHNRIMLIDLGRQETDIGHEGGGLFMTAQYELDGAVH